MEFFRVIDDGNLPKQFRNEIVKDNSSENENERETVIRSDVSNEDDIRSWIANFANISNTKWIVSETKPQCVRFTCKMTYTCHHSSKNKAPTFENNNNKKGISKNTNCRAKISFKVKLCTRDTCKKDQYVKRGLRCIIVIQSSHNHPLVSHDALKYLPPDEKLKDEFICYFQAGMGVSESRKHHYDLLESMGSSPEDFANGMINPTYRSVSYWYENWRLKEYGSKFDEDIFQMLNKKQKSFEDAGVIITYGENPFHIFVAMPLMQRAHTIPAAKNTLFIDTTSTCDNSNRAITFLLTACAGGAVPLGILITADQKTESFVAGFSALKNSIPQSFCNQGYPNYIITDNCAAEINAVKTVWPEAVHYLCIFHVLQYVWRWLSDSSHKIPETMQQSFFTFFQRILYTTDVSEAEDAFQSAVAVGQEFVNWTEYLHNQWAIKQKWCLAYRSGIEHHTNNYAEISVRIFKDNVLNRVKAYNVMVLINFIMITLERFYEQKLREFSDGRNAKPRLLFDCLLKKCAYLQKADIKVEVENCEYKVPSQTQAGIEYTVIVENGTAVCNCEMGKRGQFCKHCMAIYKFFEVISQKMPPVTVEDRRLMAYVALGDKAPSIDFFLPLHVKGLPRKELADITNCFQLEEAKKDDNADNDIIPHAELRNFEPENLCDEISLQNNSHNTESQSDEDEDGEVDMENLPAKLKQICICHREFGSEEEGMDKFLKRLKKMKSPGKWFTFLHTAANNVPLKHSKLSKIKVQPTSIQRRRAGLPRGSARLPPGRTSAKKKQKHSLHQKIFFNN